MESLEPTKVIDLHEVIQNEFPKVSQDVLNLISISADIIVGEVLHLLIQNSSSEKPEDQVDASFLFQFLELCFRKYCEKLGIQPSNELLEEFTNCTLFYMSHWSYPKGAFLEVVEKRILLYVNTFNIYYKQGKFHSENNSKIS